MKKIKIMVILALCFIGVFSYAQENEALEAKVAMAEQVLQNFDADGARVILDEVLAEDSTFAAAYYVYHEIELMRGNLSDAQTQVKKAIEFKDDDEGYRERFDELRDLINQVKEAQREIDSQNYGNAKKVYNELIEKFPTVAELYYRLGFVAIQENNYSEARDNFDRAGILAPSVEKYTKAKTVLAGKILKEAQASLKIGDLSTAERKCRTSLQVDPEFGYAYLLLGNINLRNGDIVSAQENMEKAVKYQPTSYSAWYNLGLIYKRTKNYVQAEEALLNSLKYKPNYAKAYSTLGQVYMAQNKLAQAEGAYSNAIKMDPNSASARDGYGELLNKLERYEEAVVNLKRADQLITNKKKKYLTNYRMAFAYNRLEQYNDALKVAKDVTTVNPRFGGGWYEMGLAYAKLGDTANAINAFNQGRLDKTWRPLIDPKREKLLIGKEISL